VFQKSSSSISTSENFYSLKKIKGAITKSKGEFLFCGGNNDNPLPDDRWETYLKKTGKNEHPQSSKQSE